MAPWATRTLARDSGPPIRRPGLGPIVSESEAGATWQRQRYLKVGRVHALRNPSNAVSSKALSAAALDLSTRATRIAAGPPAMSKLQARTALLSTLPAMFGGKISNLTALQRRLSPAAALLHRPAGRAALSTLSSSTARTSASKKPAASAAVAASQGPITTTISRCTPEMARGRHVFEIAGYSLAKGLGVGKFIQSGTFSVGGHDWCIQYYPDGKSYPGASSDDSDSDSDYSDFYVKDDEEEEEDDSGYISVFLARLSNGVGVRALCGLSLVNPAAGLSPEVCSSMKSPIVFSGAGTTWGFGTFKEKSELEASEYVKDDCLTIQCDISVVTGTMVSQSEPMSDIQVPPSDLSGKI